MLHKSHDHPNRLARLPLSLLDVVPRSSANVQSALLIRPFVASSLISFHLLIPFTHSFCTNMELDLLPLQCARHVSLEVAVAGKPMGSRGGPFHGGRPSSELSRLDSLYITDNAVHRFRSSQLHQEQSLDWELEAQQARD